MVQRHVVVVPAAAAAPEAALQVLEDAVALSDSPPLVFLHWVGEPLIHPGIKQILQRINQLGARLHLVTNGIKLNYAKDSLRANIMYSNGPTANAWNAVGNVPADAYSQNSGDWMLSGRFGWLASGTWEQFDDMTSNKQSSEGMLFGFGWAVWDDNDDITGGDSDTQWLLSLDASMDFVGWNLFGSITYGDDSQNAFGAIANDEGHQWGWMVQGGSGGGDSGGELGGGNGGGGHCSTYEVRGPIVPGGLGAEWSDA